MLELRFAQKAGVAGDIGDQKVSSAGAVGHGFISSFSDELFETGCRSLYLRTTWLARV
jgi:hypothetical protein